MFPHAGFFVSLSRHEDERYTKSALRQAVDASGRSYFGTTLGLPPGDPGGGMTGVPRAPVPGAPRLMFWSPATGGGEMMPLRELPPGVSARAPGGNGDGVAVCGPLDPVLPVAAGGGWPGWISAGAAGDAAGGTASDAVGPLLCA